MDIFLFVPTTALGCYLIIMLAMLHVKMTKLKKIFVGALCVYIAWTLGSVGMRFNLAPSYVFWYHASLLGLFLIPVATLIFMEAYMYGKTKKSSWFLLGVSAVVFVINVVTNGWFLPEPTRLVTEGRVTFEYDGFGVQAALPYVSYTAITVYFLIVLWKGVKEKVLDKREFFIVGSGKVLLLLGNLLILTPLFMGFPLDMAMGIPDSFGIMLMVVSSRKIRQNRETHQRNMAIFNYVLTALLSAVFAVPCVNFIQTFIPKDIERFTSAFLVIAVLIFYMITHSTICKITESLFLKEGELQLARINEFRAQAGQTLDVKKLQELIRTTAKEWVEAEWTELLVWDEAMDVYSMTHDFTDGSKVRVPANNSFMMFLQKEKKGIELATLDAQRIDDEESLERIEEMKREGIALLQPFYDERGMYAVLVVSKGKNIRYHSQERHALEILAEISMDAVRNAQLYTDVYWEARTDALTSVGNRKYLYEVLEELQGSKEQTPVAMLLIKLDDFRVFNQIYGVAGGDIGLMKVSGLLREKLPDGGHIFRYGAAEFLLVLPGIEKEEARALAEEVRLAVTAFGTMEDGEQMTLTVSIGICTTVKAKVLKSKSMDKCAMAVYMAQQEGQNRTVVFGEQEDTGVMSINRRMYREYEAIFRALTSAIDAKDHYTATHVQNVSYYAVELAKALNLSAEEIEIIKEAGLLHDIGKIGIPEAILLKPDRLNEEEFRIMKTHVNQAVTILHHLSGMEYVLPGVLGHHERYDGKGYPRGLAGENIPLYARILNVVDSFDAMISTRPYKPQLTVAYALDQIEKGKGTQFDPELAGLFLKLIKDGSIKIKRGEFSVHEATGT